MIQNDNIEEDFNFYRIKEILLIFKCIFKYDSFRNDNKYLLALLITIYPDFFEIYLTTREFYVLKKRTQLKSNGELHTLKEISIELNITQERVRQLLKSAIKKLGTNIDSFIAQLERTKQRLSFLEDKILGNDWNPAKSITLEELGLSVRSYNWLKRANINNLSDLLEFTPVDLMNIRNFGRKSAEEVLDKLEAMGYSLKKEPLTTRIIGC